MARKGTAFSIGNLKPIRKATVPGEIIEQIISMVRAGSLKPGDKLPTERELGELLDVGRSSVREALKGLETTGLLKRTTEGTILCEPKEMEQRAFWMSTINTSIHEVFETRKLLEIEIVGLAAERSTPEDIKRLEEAIVEKCTLEEVSVSDTLFHRSLVEAAKNSLFSVVYHLVTGLLFQTHRYYSFLKHDEEFETFLKTIFDQHRKILKAVESHDALSAKKAIKEHLDYAEKKLLGSLEAGPADRN